MASLSVNNVRYGGRALRSGGTLRVTENGMGFKSKQGKSISLLKEKIDRLEWLALAPNKGQLRVYTTDGPAHIYDGIPLMVRPSLTIWNFIPLSSPLSPPSYGTLGIGKNQRNSQAIF